MTTIKDQIFYRTIDVVQHEFKPMRTANYGAVWRHAYMGVTDFTNTVVYPIQLNCENQIREDR